MSLTQPAPQMPKPPCNSHPKTQTSTTHAIIRLHNTRPGGHKMIDERGHISTIPPIPTHSQVSPLKPMLDTAPTLSTLPPSP
jgi:hypothetical protein